MTRIVVVALGSVTAQTRERVAAVDMGGAPLEFVSGDQPGEVSLRAMKLTMDAWLGMCHDLDARNPTWWAELTTALRRLSAQIIIDDEHREQLITIDPAGLIVPDPPDV